MGRLGNFLNEELYGTVTDLPWGIAFSGVEGLRHPTQLYAVAKDLLIAGICMVALRRALWKPGMIFGLFLILYSILRFLLEFLRIETASGLELGTFSLTRGQGLTVPLFLVGGWLLVRSWRSTH
jgi:phosphatidylglycerol:prolipoprotein diacylglycerol transferase